MTTKTGISDKAQLATDHYIANAITNPQEGYNWHKAMLAGGYSPKTVRSKAKETWDLGGVQSQIEDARAEIREGSEDIREEVTKMFRDGAAIAKKQGNSTGLATNATGLARLNGLLTDNVNQITDAPLALDQTDLDSARARVKALQLVRDTPQQADREVKQA